MDGYLLAAYYNGEKDLLYTTMNFADQYRLRVGDGSLQASRDVHFSDENEYVGGLYYYKELINLGQNRTTIDHLTKKVVYCNIELVKLWKS